MLTTLILLAAAAASLPAQGNGVTLMSNVDQYSFYNDIWGYTAPDGREYAILGTRDGTAFYNCSNPSAPYRVGFISGPSSTWRDMKTLGPYCYIVTEGGAGMQIVSLVNPEVPVLLQTWGTSIWSHAHNIAIDVGAGMAYICGATGGVPVINLSNPTSPVLAATYTARYVHDAHVQNGLAHFAEINDGDYRIVSVASLPSFPSQDSIQTPGNFTHNTWANAGNTVCATSDESSGGGLALYDTSTPTNIQFLSRYDVSGATIHNATILGDRVYASWYTAGFVCLDISNPANPQVFGSYDTNAASGTGYDGAWGVYPFTQNGMTYVSDMDNGLFVLRVDGPVMDIAHTPLTDTQNETGPYTVTATITPLSNNFISTAEVEYSVNGGATQTLSMNPLGGDVWEAAIPGQSAPAIVDYFITATDNLARSVSDPPSGAHEFRVGVLTQIYANSFDGATDEGWTHAQLATQDDWQRGVPQGNSGDPGSAYSGANCWGNDLGPSGFNGAYQPNVHNYLRSPAIDCSGKVGVRLNFQRWLTVESGQYDQATIEVNGQVAWQNPANVDLIDTAWTAMDLDISQWADNNPSVQITFRLQSDGGVDFGGWNLDDFELYVLTSGGGGNTIVLSGPVSIPAGAPSTWNFTSAPASAPYWFLKGSSANGLTYNGHQFDIGGPVTVLMTGTTSALGGGSVTLNVPGGASGATAYFEVASKSGSQWKDSNLLTVTVL
ncbi:MAG: choice-of-anchor B family protein [Planctomycetota bacterium]|nr:choice-of-anchor B family protein [Planctomycetota bacterium]MDA1114345.1 choice-of-anchor B family protein [Planctomycetota bacterium]